MVARILFAAVSIFVTIDAFPQSACEGVNYRDGLCWYRQGALDQAETTFAKVVDSGREEPETIKAYYFLARTKMKLRKWEEASALLIRIHSLSQPFYKEWSCDFLLGEARREMGKS